MEPFVRDSFLGSAIACSEAVDSWELIRPLGLDGQIGDSYPVAEILDGFLALEKLEMKQVFDGAKLQGWIKPAMEEASEETELPVDDIDAAILLLETRGRELTYTKCILLALLVLEDRNNGIAVNLSEIRKWLADLGKTSTNPTSALNSLKNRSTGEPVIEFEKDSEGVEYFQLSEEGRKEVDEILSKF